MTLFFHELRQGRLSLLLWTLGISFFLGVCILIYPEMSSQMSEVSNIFADMGSFSAAFGMDQLNFGEFKGYFGIECGNVLGIGGALFSALLGISALAGEEKGHTAEFLLTHPISRSRVVLSKLSAVFTQILLLNAAVALVSVGTILLIGEQISPKGLSLLLLAYLLLQLEIAAITFGLSAFLRKGGLGLGLGLAVAFYFFNLIANLTESAEFLKYLTPFGYTDSAYILNNHALEGKYLLVGLLLSAVSLLLGFRHYCKKDI